MRPRLLYPASLLLAGIGLTHPGGAQTPKVLYACYVPSSGTVYRIKEPDTPLQCGSSNKKGQTVPHVEFSWTDGEGATSAHGALTGLANDDHSQYLLAAGVRQSANGFAVADNSGTGTIPMSGSGTRMMWYPAKQAFRAGRVGGVHWDDAYIGLGSAAFGQNATASGPFSFAAGRDVEASGPYSAAFGDTSAEAEGAFSAGRASHATGLFSLAIGEFAIASGDYSTALGFKATTNGKSGAFVYNGTGGGIPVSAADNGQFVVGASRFWLGDNSNVTATAGRLIETSTGAFLSSGGTWTNSSDSTLKTAFEEVDGERVLGRLASIPVRTWRYRSEDTTVRHMGPTAQEFRAAFALGDSDRAIATVDADGVSLAAIQALIRRTDSLSVTNAILQRENAGLHAELIAVADRVQQLEAQLARLAVAPSAR